MTEIPAKTCTIEEISEWYQVNEQLAALKNKEMLLRKHIFDAKFPDPVEGTNNAELPDGWLLKAKYGLNRNLDIDALNQMATSLREAGIVPEKLVKWKPELELKEYKTLSAEQRTMFDHCLLIKPGTPSLEIVMPKRAPKNAPSKA